MIGPARPGLIVLALSVLAGTARADAMRCGMHLIQPGDTKLKVLEQCGEPASRDIVSGADQPKVEQWTYVFEDARFPRLLTFKGIRVVRIETLTDY